MMFGRDHIYNALPVNKFGKEMCNTRFPPPFQPFFRSAPSQSGVLIRPALRGVDERQRLRLSERFGMAIIDD